MTIAALIVAAGRGSRAPGAIAKQYRPLAGKPVIARSVAAFLDHDDIARVVVVIHPDDEALLRQNLGAAHARVLIAHGGATRQQSVAAGLERLQAAAPPRYILIHDAARPLVSARLIGQVCRTLRDSDAVLPALPVADTLKRAEDGLVTKTVARDGLFAAQTPQGFLFTAIREAHAKAAAGGRDFTDDTALTEWTGGTVALVPGDKANMKLTTQEDFALAEAMLHIRRASMTTRTGHGFDVHAFAPGDHVVLCGITIPHERSLSGHSDADVGLHALTDALLGAICAGDIGAHFPPSDPQWKGMASDRFLKHAAGLVAAAGGRILHGDVTLICEAPKIGPHRDAMRQRIADILAIDRTRVSVKATTTEGLGFTGRREGIAAQATATIVLPEDV